MLHLWRTVNDRHKFEGTSVHLRGALLVPQFILRKETDFSHGPYCPDLFLFVRVDLVWPPFNSSLLLIPERKSFSYTIESQKT